MTASKGLSFRLRGKVGALEVKVALETTGALAIIGPNGAGKSSLLSMLLGTHRPTDGWIRLGGTVLLEMEQRLEVPVEARRWGYVPQSYALFPHLDVRENVAFGVNGEGSRSERQAKVEAGLERLGLTGLASRSVQKLSGGERQRVALARALASEPRGLLLDEPMAALDIHARAEMRSFLAGFLTNLSLPTIIVTHDAEDARALGASIAVMERGQVTQHGSWEELVASPGSAFVQALVQDRR